MLVTLKKQWNAALGQMVNVKVDIELAMRSAVATYSALPLVGNAQGDVRVTLDTKQLYVFVNGDWHTQGHIDLDNDLLQYVLQNLS